MPPIPRIPNGPLPPGQATLDAFGSDSELDSSEEEDEDMVDVREA
jgi:hypothetical protein